jgi:hypothetical protein
MIELPSVLPSWSADPRVSMPDDLAELYKRARHCFIVGEEFARTNHETQLEMFRLALESIMAASRAPNPKEQARLLGSAGDRLGRVATLDFERPARARLGRINLMWKLRAVGGMIRDIGDDTVLGTKIGELRDLLTRPNGFDYWADSTGLSCGQWLDLSNRMEKAYWASRLLYWDMTASPFRVQPLLILVGSVIGEIAAIVIWAIVSARPS